MSDRWSGRIDPKTKKARRFRSPDLSPPQYYCEIQGEEDLSSPWHHLCIPTRSTQPTHLAAADGGPCFPEDSPLSYGSRLGPDEIRLALLYPGQPDDDIFLSTEVVPTETAINNYCALSYVCGDQSDKVPIWVDNHTFQVTRNLRSALYDVRNTLHGEKVLWMWIDAISINQHDVVERSAQVQKMKQIFEEAMVVVAYIGPDHGAGVACLRNSESCNLGIHSLKSADVAIHRSWLRRLSEKRKSTGARLHALLNGDLTLEQQRAYAVDIDISTRYGDPGVEDHFNERTWGECGEAGDDTAEETWTEDGEKRRWCEAKSSGLKSAPITRAIDEATTASLAAAGVTSLHRADDMEALFSIPPEQQIEPEAARKSSAIIKAVEQLFAIIKAGFQLVARIKAQEELSTVERSQRHVQTYIENVRVLFDVVDNQYWRRAWTMPEYTSTTLRILLSGSEWMQLEDLHDALSMQKAVMSHYSAISDASDLGVVATQVFQHDIVGAQNKLALGALRRKLLVDDGGSALAQFTLLDLLLRYRRLEASDPRDKVFIPLNLLPRPLRYGEVIDVDYSLSVKDVYVQTALRVLGSTPDWPLSILELCRFDQQRKLPSWVPDWSITHVRSFFILGPYGSIPRRVDAASGLFPPSDTVPTKYIPECDGLQLCAIKVGRVCQVWPSHTTASRLEFYRSSIGLRAAEDTALVEEVYPFTGETVVQAMRSMLATIRGVDSDVLPSDRQGLDTTHHEVGRETPLAADDSGIALAELVTGSDEQLHHRVKRDDVSHQKEHWPRDQQHSEENPLTLVRSDQWQSRGRDPGILLYRRLARVEFEGRSEFIAGVLPAEAEVGDEMWAIRGGNMFYTLRQIRDVDTKADYGERKDAISDDIDVVDKDSGKAGRCLIGEAWLHGLMHGELKDYCNRQGIFLPSEEEIILY
ncbi:uncharacterized protein AB675_7039 [Cyphellophora attinorum]|uniref:Heterokaryon incompatibility domain-containing protein n=1 Tax=Cyphellophora attinorum TaxID=1664694 RepID=A0A0N0NPV8_9EURO|nr:uncharacterized protein AB675_7039 [Phialophora attinorum]KPI43178.1 hypothetical protein AB675_7039 [Phialophora attinorum]